MIEELKVEEVWTQAPFLIEGNTGCTVHLTPQVFQEYKIFEKINEIIKKLNSLEDKLKSQ